MKKFLSVLLVVVMLACCLTACGKKNKVEIKDLNSLDGLVVGFQIGTTADDLLTDLIDSKTIEATKMGNDQILTSFTQLANGEVDAVLTDSTVANAYVLANADKYELAWMQDTDPEQFGIAMPKTATELQAAINEAMELLKKDGFFDALDSKWFGDGSVELVMPSEKKIDVSLDLLNEGTLTVGSEIGYPPFEAYAADGVTPIGYDIDLTTAISILLGLKIEYINTAFDGIFGGMGVNYDIVCAAVTINDDRTPNMLFSTPYIQNYQSIVIAK